jgi:hypothetical protein
LFGVRFSVIYEFIELNPFAKAAEKLLGLEGLRALQIKLLQDPEAGDLISGGRGLRKMRVALPGRGKSGGARVIYYLKRLRGNVSCWQCTPRMRPRI